jgi:hypothetical protein
MKNCLTMLFAIALLLGTVAFNNFPKPAAVICDDLIKKDHTFVATTISSSEHEVAERAREARLEETDCDDPFDNPEADYLCNM